MMLFQAPKGIKRAVGIWLCCLGLLSLLVACHTQPRFTAEPLPRYEAAFERASGWTGGDGAYSTPLSEGRILWLFGDSFIGAVQDGRRIGSQLISNSAAIQTGREPATGALAFAYRSAPDGRPAAFLQPEDGTGWLWPYHGVRTAEGLFLFLLQIERAEGPPGFNFRLVATWLAQVVNPDQPPNQWSVRQHKIPWGDERRLFGSAVLCEGPYCYIYGTGDEAAHGLMRKHMILARAPAGEMGNFEAWRFFAGDGWAVDADRAARVCEAVASEFSVSYLPELGRYVLIYSEGGLSPHVVLRSAPRPEGPWSAPMRVYTCPEAAWDSRIFCYAAKGHPEIAGAARELIVTYMTNATDLALLESDARLYRPRFIRILFECGL